jgi:phosphoribosylanthranilate isomerase
VQVKICGLTCSDDLIVAQEAGADVLGFIYGVPESPRSNRLEALPELLSHKKSSEFAILTRNATKTQLYDISLLSGVDIQHLCGQEPPDLWKELKDRSPDISIWQTIGIPIDDPTDEAWKHRLEICWDSGDCDTIVLDSAKGGKAGGTGQTFPFRVVADHLGIDSQNVWIAGGLTPDNLEPPLKIAQWKGLDVSSGVESSLGKKDHDKIRAFLQFTQQWKTA